MIRICHIPAGSEHGEDHFLVYDTKSREVSVERFTSDGEVVEVYAVRPSDRREVRSDFEWFVKRGEAYWLEVPA